MNQRPRRVRGFFIGKLGRSFPAVMHLRNYPQYFVKDGKRRPVYYTADASQLRALGWRPEGQPEPERQKEAQKPVIVEQETKPEKLEVEVVEEVAMATASDDAEEPLPDLEFMTKNELIKFAADHGEALQSTALKADLVEACRKLVRARDDQGRFLGDDPTTIDINEAWTLG